MKISSLLFDQMTIEITRLIYNSPDLQICAEWRYEAFLKSYGYSLLDSAAQLTKLATRPDEYETALIACVDGRLAGICLLVLQEFEPLHDVSPWLASLYVAPEYRERGVARKLVAAIEDQARSNGVARLHLYTGDAEKFYLKCDWSLAEQGIADGEPYAFMIRDL
jgi:GNAT superfamily N-acetyltransferase